jgi:hypothetical protein
LNRETFRFLNSGSSYFASVIISCLLIEFCQLRILTGKSLFPGFRKAQSSPSGDLPDRITATHSFRAEYSAYQPGAFRVIEPLDPAVGVARSLKDKKAVPCSTLKEILLNAEKQKNI